MPNQTINLRIERRQDVLDKVRFSRSTLYSRIQQGLFVPPVSLGRRSVGWLEHETDIVIRGFVSGKTDLEIKELVKEVIALRANLCDQILFRTHISSIFRPERRECYEPS